MNVQQHQRIARIKQISGYLYVCLTWIRNLLWVIWSLVVLAIMFGKTGHFVINELQLNIVEFTVLQRVLMVAMASLFLFIIMKMIFHFRALIQSFSTGDIFNKTAIDHARKALLHGMLVYGVCLSVSLIGWVYVAVQNVPVTVSFNGDFIFWLMLFGLMYVLLWTLEIGCDLNEESELTI